jgi:O-antigen ligase
MASIIDERQDQTEFTGSRETRRIVMLEGLSTFMERPLTGVGVGQFRNYNPPGRIEKWNETHNALIQVAAETGIAGLVAFLFLIVQGSRAAAKTRRLLASSRKRRESPVVNAAFRAGERELLYEHTVALTAGLVGWFTCALFASVAYSWTFYYVLALIIAAREITTARVSAVARRLENGQSVSVPAVNVSRPWAPGVA